MVISLMTGPTSVPWVTNSNDLTINVINNTDLSMEIKTSKYFSVYGRIGRSPWTSLLQTTQQQQQQQQQQEQQLHHHQQHQRYLGDVEDGEDTSQDAAGIKDERIPVLLIIVNMITNYINTKS